MQKTDKNKNRASRWIIYSAIGVVTIIVIASLNAYKPMEYKISAKDMHQTVLKGEHLIKPSVLYKAINEKKDHYQIIDLRTPYLFNMFHIDGSVNIPADMILGKDAQKLLHTEGKKVLVCANTIKASEIYMLLNQYGYNDLYVMEGGVSYWKFEQASIKNGTDSLAIDEKAWYDYPAIIKTIAGDNGTSQSKSSAPAIQIQRKKKKTAGGGCG
ncbi:MAG: rhodanese-like domain-containing protein [Bacteroidales bacterium]|nr:rhodanese-like domain-containing protein [Bacteroidales bacterium]